MIGIFLWLLVIFAFATNMYPELVITMVVLAFVVNTIEDKLMWRKKEKKERERLEREQQEENGTE